VPAVLTVKEIGPPVETNESTFTLPFRINRYLTPEELAERLIVAVEPLQIVPPPVTLKIVSVLMVNAEDSTTVDPIKLLVQRTLYPVPAGMFEGSGKFEIKPLDAVTVPKTIGLAKFPDASESSAVKVVDGHVEGTNILSTAILPPAQAGLVLTAAVTVYS
jgi:hypothetical protein